VAKRYPLETLLVLKRRAKEGRAKEQLQLWEELQRRQAHAEAAFHKLAALCTQAEEHRASETAQLLSGGLRIQDMALNAAFEARVGTQIDELRTEAERAQVAAQAALAESERAAQALLLSRAEESSVAAHRERWSGEEKSRVQDLAEEDAADVANNLRSRNRTRREA